MITLKRNIGYKIGYCLAFFGTLLALGTSPSMPLGAQNANPASDFEYDLNQEGTGVLITKYKGNSKNVIIPSTIEDFPVVKLKGAFFGTDVESVVIPDSVTYLTSNGNFGCFEKCESLKKIRLPKGLKYIDTDSFCSSGLESISIPDSVVNIYQYAFAGCEQLKTVIIGSGVQFIGNSAFSGCSALTTVNIGSDVKQIADDAFSHCTALESIRIPDNVIYIGEKAFSSCKQLKTVTIGNGVQVIDEYAFGGCTALTTVSIGSGIKCIRSKVFGDCTALTSFNIGVAYLGNTDTDNSPTFEIELIESFGLLYLDRRTAQSHQFGRGYASNAFVGCTALSLKEKKKIRDSGYTGEFGSSKK